MNEILDATEETKPDPQTIFSKFSLGFALLSILLLGLLIVQVLYVYDNIRVGETLEAPPLTLIFGIMASCLMGMVSTMMSFVKRERSSLIKWIGAVLNITMFIFIAGSILSVRIN